MKLRSFLCLIVITLLQSSCIVSTIIASHGLRVEDIETEKEFEKKMGKPIYVAKYNPQKIIKDTPEYKRTYAGISGYSPDKYEDLKASRLCVYRHRGRFYSDSRGTYYAMRSAITFCIAEPWLIMEALYGQFESKKRYVHYCAWFNQSGELVAGDYYKLSK